MGLVVQIRAQKSGSKVLRFDDDQERIVFGRDPARCQVLFAEDVTVVGREHCAVRRVLGRYRLVLNGENLVFVDGEPAMDDQELPEQCELQLGPKGPRLKVRRLEQEDLPATLDQGRQKGRATILQETRSTARRNQVLMVIVIVAAAVGAWFGIDALRDTDEDIKKTQRDVDETREEIAGTRERIEVLTDKVGSIEGGLEDVTGVREAIASMQGKLDQVEADVERLGPRLKEGLARARQSVYLTLFRTPDGLEQGGGTAWVVGDGMLATNGHVAENFDRILPGVEMLVRSPDAEPKTFRVKEVRIHPGYKAFETLWFGFQPVQGTNLKNSVPVDAAGAACDVALLIVDDPRGELAPPLKLAAPETLRNLGAGDVIGFVGYPMENMALTGSPVKRPSPQTQTGHVTAVTNYFGATDEATGGENHLIQHSCPAGGGASGSPVLNADGEVIAVLSGGNNVVVPTGDMEAARVSSGVDINFAQRVDLLREVLDRRAERLQPERTRRWGEVINELFASGFLMEREASIEGTLNDLAFALQDQSGHRSAYVWSQKEEGESAADGRSRVEFRLPAPGTYLVMTLADRAQEVQMRATVHPAADAAWDLREDIVAPYLRYAMFTTPERGELRLRAEGEDALSVTFKLYQARERPLSTDSLRQQLLNAWLSQVDVARGVEHEVELAVSGDVRLEANKAWEGHTDPLATGDYFATVISTSKKDVDASLSTNAGVALGEDRRDDYFPTVTFTLAEPDVVNMSIVGVEPGLEVEVRIFRAVPK